MSTAVLSVPDISCEHCEQVITSALAGQPGVRSVRVDVSDRQVRLDYDERQLSLDRARELLADEDYAPKHGSWLEIAEIELRTMNGQCLDRRVPDRDTVEREVATWEAERNARGGRSTGSSRPKTPA